MFGRVLSVEVIEPGGKSTFLVDPEQDINLKCSGTIEYMSVNVGAPTATIEVYNLSMEMSKSIFSNKKIGSEDGVLIRIKHGYRDEGSEPSLIFIGKVKRAFTTRVDATTTITKIYAHQLSEFFTSGVSSVYVEDGTSIYDCVQKLFETSTVQDITVNIPITLKDYYLEVGESLFGKTVDLVNQLVKKAGHILTVGATGVNIVPEKPSARDMEVIVLATLENNKLRPQSGLIGYPSVDTEGIRFDTLINPKISLYSYVWLPGAAIIERREGFTMQANLGASYDVAGLYRVVKMVTRFDSRGRDSKTSYVALSAGIGSEYYK